MAGEKIIETIDITRQDLYIKKILNVIKIKSTNSRKLKRVNCRSSDALFYILAGSGTFTVDNGDECTVGPQDMLYLAGGASYTSYIYTENLQFILCNFEFDAPGPLKSAVYTLQDPSHAENLFRRLLSCYATPTKATFAECMSLLYSIYGVITATAAGTTAGGSIKHKIAEAKADINIMYKDPQLSVGALAEKVGVSEVYFRKLFKAEYRISPSQYITSVRLKKAKELMKNPFLTLEDCALESGFSSLQYFCRVFKKATGTTPARYRSEK